MENTDQNNKKTKIKKARKGGSYPIKFLSFNARGTGKKGKMKEIREMISKHNINTVYIQETKMTTMHKRVCGGIWGCSNFDWVCKDSKEQSGGMLTLWNCDAFNKISSFYGRGFLVVNGVWKAGDIQCCIINVYASCIHSEKLELWVSLSLVLGQCMCARRFQCN